MTQLGSNGTSGGLRLWRLPSIYVCQTCNPTIATIEATPITAAHLNGCARIMSAPPGQLDCTDDAAFMDKAANSESKLTIASRMIVKTDGRLRGTIASTRTRRVI